MLFVLISCGSEDEQDPGPGVMIIAPDNPMEIRTILSSSNSKEWVTTEFTMAGMELECRLDDTFEFNNDGSFRFDGGDKLCGLEDILTIREGTWTLMADENKIKFDLGSGEVYFADYQKITEEEIRLSGSWGGMKIKGAFVPSDG